jgi:hypothetical protein
MKATNEAIHDYKTIIWKKKKIYIYIYNKIKLRTKQGENVREMKSTTG